ncbi:MAG: cation:proton antiporter [Dehalococcoidia bacterium]|nr:cation:proton antiporter [Dehalococcoidia bacterium]
MEELEFLNSIAIALGLAFAGGFVARLLGIPTIVGYLVAGVVISPFTPGYDADAETIRELAEIGVIFLMFGVGLHFNLSDLLSVKGVAIPGSVVLISGTAAVTMAGGVLFDLGWREGLVLGLALSIASSVVLTRGLQERGLIEGVAGRMAIGWSIVEDLATVLFLALLPSLSAQENGNALLEMAEAVAKAAIFLAIMLVAGPRVIPWLLRRVALLGSRELFIVAVVAIALGIATSATWLGVSVALGAFIAGVVVSETEMGHQAAADVIPLREAFAVLFFVSVGMLLDPQDLLEDPAFLAFVVAVVIGVKAVVIIAMFAFFPYPARTALAVAAGLAQMGEFSFLVANEALHLEILSARAYNVLLAASIISIAFNPLAWRLLQPGERFLQGTGPLWRILERQGPPLPQVEVGEGHVVILGYGRVGELTGHALDHLGVPHIIVEADLPRARRLVAAGKTVVWGDAALPEVIEQTRLDHARLLAVALPDENTTFLAVANARRLHPELPIVVRARDRLEVPVLREMGVAEIVVPEYEGGLALMRQTLVSIGYEPEEALHYASAVRDIHYGFDTASEPHLA